MVLFFFLFRPYHQETWQLMGNRMSHLSYGSYFFILYWPLMTVLWSILAHCNHRWVFVNTSLSYLLHLILTLAYLGKHLPFQVNHWHWNIRPPNGFFVWLRGIGSNTCQVLFHCHWCPELCLWGILLSNIVSPSNVPEITAQMTIYIILTAFSQGKVHMSLYLLGGMESTLNTYKKKCS